MLLTFLQYCFFAIDSVSVYDPATVDEVDATWKLRERKPKTITWDLSNKIDRGNTKL